LNRKDGSLKWKHRPAADGEHVGAPITDGTHLFAPLDPLFDYEKQRKKAGISGVVAVEEAKE